ncbi:hypothetical protein [Fredinandcohnia quinoae]|uniref:Lipoprotein n=1 Tax=Fredinandcohnia quinoae TaxID=2918902 RepID=A0AAW5DYE1_9BACI|nr:hypothetical protein [Fredinandcohnia sp. SECRCQ15]MCH1625388.1 hypothetical protein [Fredinandcohnia sp. SECRCQ15]
MKKKTVVSASIFSIIIILIFVNLFKDEVWEENATKLKASFHPVSGSAIIDDFATWTPFKWDTLYSFSPYTSKDIIYNTVGYKWDKIDETVSEGMTQIVFVNDGKVVCYLYGHPENNNIGFDFGEYTGNYIKLTNEQKLRFKVTELNNIYYLDYIK